MNFKVVTALVAEPDADHWIEVSRTASTCASSSVDAFAGHLVISERADGGQRLRVRRLSDGAEHTIEQPEEAASVWLGANSEFDTTTIRYGFSSLVTPTTDYDYDLEHARTHAREAPAGARRVRS